VSPSDASDVLRLEVGPVDLARRLVRREDQDRTLTTKETELLGYLSERMSTDISREQLLTDVWGYRPGVMSRTADTTVQRLRAKIERDPANPRHLLTVHGFGYRFEPLLGVPLGPEPSPEEATPEGPSPTNLRPDPGRFVGRTDERAHLLGLLTGGARVVTVLGSGGTGKTRLAREVGMDLADTGAFPGGVWFCDLTESRDTAHVLRVVGRVLDVPLGQSAGLRDPVERIGRDLLARGATVLVLDNAEQVLEEAAPLFAGWVDGLPAVRFLITSRERLRIGPEVLLELSPLDEDSAIELFLERAATARPRFTPDETVRATAKRITQRLDHLPLAIELVAPRIAVLAPEVILARLEDRFRLARSARRDLPARQRTLRAALDWSWELLTPAEQTALAQCAVFRGGFLSEDAEEVVSFEDMTNAPWVPDVLQALLDKSLLRSYEPEDVPGDTRLGMLESIREYASAQLEDSGDGPGTVDRHRRVVLARADRLAPELLGSDGVRAFRRLALESDNLAAVMDQSDGPETTARAALMLQEVLVIRGPAGEHRALLDGAIAATAEAPPELRVELYIDRARIRRRSGDPTGALSDADKAIAIARPLGGSAIAEAIFARGLALHFADQPLDAIPIYEDAVARFEELGDMRGLLRARPILAFLLWTLGRRVEAEPMLRESLQAVGDLDLLVYATRNMARLGLILGARGRWEEALELVRLGSLGHQMLGSRRGESLVLANLSAFESARGRLDDAVAHGEEALAVHGSSGDPIVRAVILRNLGLLEADRGDHGRAREHLLEALEAHTALRDDLGQARVWTDLGELALLTGAPGEAERAYVKAQAAAEDAGDRRQIAIVRGCSAVLAHVRGEDVSRAGEVMDDALNRLRPIAGPRLLGCFKAMAAAMAADRGELDLAKALLEKASATLGELGDRNALGTLRLCRAVVSLARARAGEEDAAVLRERAARAVRALAADHSAHEVSVPRLLYERARAR